MKNIITRCKIKISVLTFFGLVLSPVVVAHEAHNHDPKKAQEKKEEEISKPAALQEVSNEYKRFVQPIFRTKCFDCHSDQTRYPWYYPLPFARWLINRDIREAHKHMDMTQGFPFKGHGSPQEDLESIAKVVNKGTMPPWRYILMHWDARLTDEEKKVILEWVEESLAQLLRQDAKRTGHNRVKSGL